jgi:autotransporter adhesin
MKLNKIKLAMISAGLLLSYTAHAQNTNTNTGTDSAVAGVYDTNFTSGEPVASTLSTDGSAKIRTRESSTGSYSTATGNTFTVPPSTSTVYSGVSSTATIDGRTVRYYDAGSSSLGANIDNTAIGDGARAGYGVQENPDFVIGGTAAQYLGDGNSTAVGADSLATTGGSAFGVEAEATGKDSVAIGKEAVARGYKSIAVGEDSVASGEYDMAVGNGAVAEGTESTALGAEAEASGENSVALGAGSVADRDNNVSVGSAGNERTISNVAPGVYGTDAVNVNQLKAVERKISAGVSAAMAMTTPVIAAGKSNAVALGAASYNNTSAIALNLAHKFTDDVVATASVSKGFNSGRTSSGSNDDIGIKGSVSWSF